MPSQPAPGTHWARRGPPPRCAHKGSTCTSRWVRRRTRRRTLLLALRVVGSLPTLQVLVQQPAQGADFPHLEAGEEQAKEWKRVCRGCC